MPREYDYDGSSPGIAHHFQVLLFSLSRSVNMQSSHYHHTITFAAGAVLLAFGLVSSQPNILLARDKQSAVDPNDVTLRLYQFLDDTHEGKLSEFYLIADTF